MTYKKGAHIIATLKVLNGGAIQSYQNTKVAIDELVQQYQLTKLGEVYHDFDGGGFTAVVCLSESHLSIHTWPEYQLLNMDIYLSNYKQDNTIKGEGLFNMIVTFFNATIQDKKVITR
jgi:S-adenosylmethionine decarboxylase